MVIYVCARVCERARVCVRVCGWVGGQKERRNLNVTLLLPTGFFEFKICPTNDPKKQETQECFDRYPLSLSDGSGYRYYIPTTAALMGVDLVLPQNLTCEFCVLQFCYHTGMEASSLLIIFFIA